MTDQSAVCPVCASHVQPGAAFCGVCASPLTVVPSQGATPVARPGAAASDASGPALPSPVAPILGPVSPAPVSPVPVSLVPVNPVPTGVVPAGLVPAGVGVRVAALLIDQLAAGVVAGVAFAVMYAVGRSGTDTDSSTTATVGYLGALLLPGILAAVVGVGQWVWEARTGRTLGGSLLGLRTLSLETGRPAGLGRIFLRLLVQGLGSLACYVGTYVVAASGAWDASGRRQGWHDKAAGTIVVAVPRGLTAATAPGATSAAAPATAGAPSGLPLPAPDAAHPAARASAPDPVALAREAFGPPAAVAPGESSGLIASVPGFGAPAVDASSVPVPVPVPVPLPAPAHDPEDEADDLDRTRMTGAGSAAAPVIATDSAPVLVLDTGERIQVRGEGVIGRNPSAAPGSEVVHVVPLADTTRSVSKTHLAFGVDGAGLWVCDLHSTNGSAIVATTGQRTPLEPGVRAHVVPGDVVELGERRVEVAR